jgi:hypothetical protein
MTRFWTKGLTRAATFLIVFGMATSPFAQPRRDNPQVGQTRVNARQAIMALSQGGYIIYFRHFETGADTPDRHLVRLDDCASQRQLNAKGVRQAVQVRDVFQALKIPVGDVLASPFCRTWQSADIVFGRHVKVDGLKLPPSKDYTDTDRKTMRDVLMPLLAQMPPSGFNTIIMAHDDNMPAAGGPEIKTQGEAVIIKPDGKGDFSVVAQIKPGRWRAALPAP